MTENLDIKTILGSNIRHYRKQKHLSQEKFAELSGVSVRYISYIETGLSFPSEDKLKMIASALDVQPYVLFYPDNSISNPDFQLSIERILREEFSRAYNVAMMRILQEVRA